MELGALLAECQRQSVFYRARLQGARWTAAGAPRAGRDSHADRDDNDRALLAHVPPLLLEQVAAPPAGDPLHGRGTGRRAPVLYQLAYDIPVFQAFGRNDLDAYAGVLTDIWRAAGVKPGHCVAIYDYGSSPIAYLASRAVAPYLRQGAAERLGVTVICNDGLPELVERWWHVLTYVQPQVVFLRSAAMAPFARLFTRRGGWPATPPQALLVSDNEEWPPAVDVRAWERMLGVPVRRLARADLAAWLALECAAGRVHVDQTRYAIEVLDRHTHAPVPPGEEGLLTLTCRFARMAPVIRYVSSLPASWCTEPCPCGCSAPSLALG